MKHDPFTVCALVSALAAGVFVGCGDDDTPSDGSAGSAGASGKGGSGGAGGSAGRSGTGGSSAGSSGTGGSGGTAATGGQGGDPGSGVAGEGGKGDGGAGGAEPPSLCEEFGSLCHPYDLGPGPQHDCHELGHAGDEALCATKEAECRQACETAETIPFTIHFGAKVGEEPFDCSSTYTGLGADDSTVHPVDFRFYVHDVRLINDAGDEVPVTLTQDGVWQYQGVALLDFEDGSGDCEDGTAEKNDKVVGTVPFGVYRGIVYKLGVPFELNHTEIDDTPAPLNLDALFWDTNRGRVFLSIVNSTEIENDDRFETLLLLGSANCTGSGTAVESCAKPNRPEYRFPTFRLGRNVAVADMKEVLQSSNLKSDQCRSLESDACPWPFEYLGINWSTGTLTPSTQRLFRME